MLVNKCACGRSLTSDEKTYFGTHCTTCETAMSDALNEDKDPCILTKLFQINAGMLLPVVGFDPSALNKEYDFHFIDGSVRKATLIGSNAHCSYDEDGNPRNVLINLDFA